MTRATKSKVGTPPAPIILAIPPADVLGRLAALKTTATPDLKQQWRELFAAEPPPYNRRFLESRLVYRIQELAYGGLKPETIQRLEALGEQLDGGNPVLRRIRGDDKPITGTRLSGTPRAVGGWGGIRTHDTLLTYTHFPGARLRPLGHPSALGP